MRVQLLNIWSDKDGYILFHDFRNWRLKSHEKRICWVRIVGHKSQWIALFTVFNCFGSCIFTSEVQAQTNNHGKDTYLSSHPSSNSWSKSENERLCQDDTMLGGLHYNKRFVHITTSRHNSNRKKADYLERMHMTLQPKTVDRLIKTKR